VLVEQKLEVPELALDKLTENTSRGRAVKQNHIRELVYTCASASVPYNWPTVLETVF